jgi:hypothetical protein
LPPRADDVTSSYPAPMPPPRDHTFDPALPRDERAWLEVFSDDSPYVVPTDVLAALLRDPALSDRVRDAAAFAARFRDAPELGPPLLDALGLTSSLDTRRNIIHALASSRHIAAAPAVLEALCAAADARFQAQASIALAMFRYRPAEAAIRAVAEGPFPRGTGPTNSQTEAWIRDQARLSLVRLLGDWGAPREGLSLLLAEPEEAIAGEAIRAMVYIEHDRGAARLFGTATTGRFFVEGIGYTPPMQCYLNRSFTLDPSVLWKREICCGAWPAAPGSYRLRYEAGAALSNTLTVAVKAR